MTPKLKILRYFMRRIRMELDFAKDFPTDALEHTGNAKEYTEILYHLIKEGLLP